MAVPAVAVTVFLVPGLILYTNVILSSHNFHFTDEIVRAYTT